MLELLSDAELWKREDSAEELVRRYKYLAHREAMAYRRSPEYEDVLGNALVGLVSAVKNYDPTRGIPFAPYCSLIVTGHIKRGFRDNRLIRIPRGLHDHFVSLRKAERKLGERPLAELAEAAGMTEAEAEAAMQMNAERTTMSLDAPPTGMPDGDPMIGQLVASNGEYQRADEDVDLQAALARLEPVEQIVLELRFVEDLRQWEIAQMLDYSQMHISRLIKQALANIAPHLA